MSGLNRARPVLFARTSASTIELLWVAGLILSVFAVNIATVELYPLAWLDEAAYADPAINLVRGHGLTSSAWYNVYWGHLWYDYPPLNELLLAPWLMLTGIDLPRVRSFNFVVISAAALAFWYYARRSGAFSSRVSRLAMLLLPLLGYSLSSSYRSGRPDALCVLLTGLALVVSTMQSRWRATLLALIGIAVAWTAVQLTVFALILGTMVLVWWPREAVRTFRPLAAGGVIGGLSLLGFYAVQDSLFGFLASTIGSYHTLTGQLVQGVLLSDQRSLTHLLSLRIGIIVAIFEDRSTVLLGMGAVLLLIASWVGADRTLRPVAAFASVAAIVVPTLVALAGKYPLYYAWMGLVTVGVPTIAGLDLAVRSPQTRLLRALALTAVVAALATGLPVQVARAYSERAGRDYDSVRAYVGQYVAPGDWVYANRRSYFAVVERDALPILDQYATGRLAPGIPDEQKRRLKEIVVAPDEVDAAIARLGGEWMPAGPAFVPAGPVTRLTWGEEPSGYNLVAYRRK